MKFIPPGDKVLGLLIPPERDRNDNFSPFPKRGKREGKHKREEKLTIYKNYSIFKHI